MVELSPLAPIIVFPVLFYSLMFMIGKALQNSSLIIISRNEFFEYVLFLALFVALTSFLFSDVANNLFGLLADYINKKIGGATIYSYTTGANASRNALISSSLLVLDYNAGVLSDILNAHSSFLRDASAMASLTSQVSFLSSTSIEFPRSSDPESSGIRGFLSNPAADAGASLSPCTAYNAVIRPMSGFSYFLGIAYMALEFQRFLIEQLSSQEAITVLLAIGIILRANPITRGGGAFFLALAIGLYSIMPFSILVSNAVVNTYFTGQAAIQNQINSFYNSIKVELSGVEALVFPCPNSKLTSYLSKVKNAITSSGSVISSFVFFVILAQGITLLTFVSIVGGIAKILGAEISPFIIGRLTYYISGG